MSKSEAAHQSGINAMKIKHSEMETNPNWVIADDMRDM
jgi:hypothetical protein